MESGGARSSHGELMKFFAHRWHELANGHSTKPLHHRRNATKVIVMPVRHDNLLEASGASLGQSRLEVRNVVCTTIASVHENALASSANEVRVGPRQSVWPWVEPQNNPHGPR